jgi:hypothetical protein
MSLGILHPGTRRIPAYLSFAIWHLHLDHGVLDQFARLNRDGLIIRWQPELADPPPAGSGWLHEIKLG